MKKDSRVYLADMQTSIDRIEAYIDGMTLADFTRDLKTQDAVIRHLAIIGESIGRLDTEFLATHPAFPLRQAISMRNFLIHDYDAVNVDIVWDTITIDLPLLRKQVGVALSEFTGK